MIVCAEGTGLECALSPAPAASGGGTTSTRGAAGSSAGEEEVL